MSDFLNRMKKTHRPVVLTVNDKAALVVQDAAGYQKTLDRLEELEAIEAIRAGIDSAAQGRVKPASKALAELQEILGIPG